MTYAIREFDHYVCNYIALKVFPDTDPMILRVQKIPLYTSLI
jgi:hypothetical protein